jgi:excisionase family DNA binding protein
MNAIFEPFVTSEQAGEFLCLHPKTVEKMAREGRIPARKIGKFWRFRLSELDIAVSGTVKCAGCAYRLKKEEM